MFLKKILASCLLAAGAAQAAPVLIDFDGLASGTVLEAQYAGLGVTFANAQVFNLGPTTGGSAPNLLVSLSDFSLTQPANPIVARFASGMSTVSLTGLDVGAAGFLLTAYDALAGCNVVDTRQVFGSALGIDEFFTLSVNGTANILRVEFSQVNGLAPEDGMAFDNLVFDVDGAAAAVPEPGTLALFGLALAGLLGARRRLF